MSWEKVEMFYQIKLTFSFVLTKILIWYQNSKKLHKHHARICAID